MRESRNNQPSDATMYVSMSDRNQRPHYSLLDEPLHEPSLDKIRETGRAVIQIGNIEHTKSPRR